MKTSQMLFTTLREVPAEAETTSHRLMLRAGLIRKLASGVYSFLPLGLKVLKKVEQIINGESSEYPYLGIEMYNVSNINRFSTYYRYTNNGKINTGVLVAAVQSHTSASAAKLQTGDILVKINNNNIDNVAFLRYELYKHKVGDSIKVTFIRDGKEKTVTVKLSSKLQTS